MHWPPKGVNPARAIEPLLLCSVGVFIIVVITIIIVIIIIIFLLLVVVIIIIILVIIIIIIDRRLRPLVCCQRCGACNYAGFGKKQRFGKKSVLSLAVPGRHCS